MDKLSELSHGAKIVLGSAIAFFIVSLFNWFKVGDTGVGTMWNGVGILAGLLVIALIVWQGIRLANIELEIGVGPAMVTTALAVLLLIFTFIRFISKPGGSLASSVVDRTFWAWIGLILAIVIVVGAWMNMQATGESVQAMMDRFGSKEATTAPPAETTPPAATTSTPPPPPPAAPPPEQTSEPVSPPPEEPSGERPA